MGASCNKLLQNEQQNTFKNKLLDAISIPFRKTNQQQISSLPDDLNVKLQFIKQIQNQIIKQGNSGVVSCKKLSDDRVFARFSNGTLYKGTINQLGMRDREGQQHFTDGTKYIGAWKNNLPDGYGIIVSQNGFVFQGNWLKGNVQGFGKYFGKLGTYEGNWSQNRHEGFGVETWEDGSKYEGNYKEGKRHGQGKYIWMDKSKYDGAWQKGQINGFGAYSYVDGRVYKGNFKNNKMHGDGTYVWPDGRKYVGSYIEDKKEGKGKYYWPDGRFYEGEWSNGQRNGYGKIVYPNGLVKYGLWENDQRIEELSENKNPKNNFNQIHQDQTIKTKYSASQRLQRSRSSQRQQEKKSRYGRNSTQSKVWRQTPLYASSISPYKQLKKYYQDQKTDLQPMKQLILNRSKFINYPLQRASMRHQNKQDSYFSSFQVKDKNRKTIL